jgi:lysophospholipase L1-like esterase
MTTARHKSFFVLPMLVLAVIGCSSPSARAELLIRDGDRVVFYGDSITEFHNYTRPFQDYVYARYPERKIRFFNAGWSGDKTGGALNRLERDVLWLKPTVVTICFGMNDGLYTALTDFILNTYRTNLDGIVKALTDKGVRVIVFSPPPVDYDRQGSRPLREAKYNENLEALGNAGREVAQKYGATYIDIIHPLLAAQAALKAKNAGYTMIPDSIHPDEKGGVAMAGAMLLGMGAEPMPPLADISASQLTGTDKNQITLTAPVNIPLWLNDDSVQAAKAVGFLDVAAQKLRVRGLAPGTYEVRINGNTAGTWNNADLEAGVLVPGGYSARARRLYDVTNWKEGNYYNAWRVLRIGAEQGPAIESAVAALMKADDGFQSAIESLSTPASGLVLTVQSTGLPPDVGPNLALGKPYDVSDPNLHNYGIGGLTDGSWSIEQPHTFATNEADVFPKTATIDLGRVQTVSHVLLGVPPFGATKTVKVAISRDGQNFTEVGSYVFSQNREEKHLYTFAPAPARYVRLIYSDHYDQFIGYLPTFTFTTEAEVYGPAQ